MKHLSVTRALSAFLSSASLLFGLLVASPASAIPTNVYLTELQLQSFSLYYNTCIPGVCNVSNPPAWIQNAGTGEGMGQYTFTFTGQSGAVTSIGRLQGLNLGTAGDNFGLTILNINGNPWDFTLAINGVTVGSITPLTNVPPNNEYDFTTVLTGAINTIELTVGATVPMQPNNDRTAQFNLTNIPEPGTVLLLGIALLGLSLSRRRAST